MRFCASNCKGNVMRVFDRCGRNIVPTADDARREESYVTEAISCWKDDIYFELDFSGMQSRDVFRRSLARFPAIQRTSCLAPPENVRCWLEKLVSVLYSIPFLRNSNMLVFPIKSRKLTKISKPSSLATFCQVVSLLNIESTRHPKRGNLYIGGLNVRYVFSYSVHTCRLSFSAKKTKSYTHPPLPLVQMGLDEVVKCTCFDCGAC